LQIAELAAVDGNHIGEPHRDVGQIVGQDFLYFAAECFAFFLIHFHTNLVGERVDARVAVVSAIGAIGRESFGGKNKFEDVGIVVGANPTQESQLEISVDGVGEESCEFEWAEFEVDTGFAPLFLQRGADQTGLFFGGGF